MATGHLFNNFIAMFDDHLPSGGGQPPTNLPTGEPEDMFAHVDSVDDTSGSSTQPIAAPLDTEDPGAEVQPAPTAVAAGALRPVHTTPPPPQMRPTESAREVQPPPSSPSSGVVSSPSSIQHIPPSPELYQMKEPGVRKGLLTMIIIVVVILILGIGGSLLYVRFGASDTTSTSEVPVSDVPETIEDDVLAPIDLVDESDLSDITDDVDVVPVDFFGEPVDADGDGLDDIREASIGTDSAHWDTDGDELSDGDEVIIWKTDPLNPDTDGDTYLDGEEIRSGYSPTGPGRIFELPSDLPATDPEAPINE